MWTMAAAHKIWRMENCHIGGKKWSSPCTTPLPSISLCWCFKIPCIRLATSSAHMCFRLHMIFMHPTEVSEFELVPHTFQLFCICSAIKGFFHVPWSRSFPDRCGHECAGDARRAYIIEFLPFVFQCGCGWHPRTHQLHDVSIYHDFNWNIFLIFEQFPFIDVVQPVCELWIELSFSGKWTRTKISQISHPGQCTRYIVW